MLSEKGTVMITAIVLICAVNQPTLCYYSTYPDMLATEEDCIALITQAHIENRFTALVEGQLFTLRDYRCINWNAKRI